MLEEDNEYSMLWNNNEFNQKNTSPYFKMIRNTNKSEKETMNLIFFNSNDSIQTL